MKPLRNLQSNSSRQHSGLLQNLTPKLHEAAAILPSEFCFLRFDTSKQTLYQVAIKTEEFPGKHQSPGVMSMTLVSVKLSLPHVPGLC